MFDQLTQELLDLTSRVRGDRLELFAMELDCCSCSCCGCIVNC
jgi:hypothetical protein